MAVIVIRRRRGPHYSTGRRRQQRTGSCCTCAVVVVVVVVLVVVTVLVVVVLPADKQKNGDDGSSSRRDNGDNINSAAVVEGGEDAGGGFLLRQSLRAALRRQRDQFQDALESTSSSWANRNIPARLRVLRERDEIVGERLWEVRAGKETVEEIIHSSSSSSSRRRQHGGDKSDESGNNNNAIVDLPPMQLDEIVSYLDDWIHRRLPAAFRTVQGHSTAEGIWQAYHDLTVKTLYPWDVDYLRRMPSRRDDGSIFLSLATYRDENCFNTIYNAYNKSKNPHKLFVGMVQQNCRANCRSGVLANRSVVPADPDDNCYQLFCNTTVGKPICDNGQVRLLDIDEPQSLGPYAARYFASKLWYGEEWYMQIDSHMTFATNWDAISIAMLKKAPSSKPVLSHYPPPDHVDLDGEAARNKPASRLCGPMFAEGEGQIVRLEGAGNDGPEQLEYPAFAPFTAAGYFVAHSSFLKEVPFDPFLPWIFMGEEIITSSRLWTSGFDIFSPTRAVVGHVYVRRHKPKFWESVNRAFSTTFDAQNNIQRIVIDRIKHQLGYPEASRDMIWSPQTVLTAVEEQYGMGNVRSLHDYMKMIGLNTTRKEVTYTGWCEEGYPPPGFERYNELYPAGRKRIMENNKKEAA